MGDKTDKADRLTFWRGWWEGLRHYPDAERLAIYDAILAYAFEGEEPAPPAPGNLTATIVYSEISHIRETIGISRARRQAGAKGGSKRQANTKQAPSKHQANAKHQTKKAQANRNQEQEQVQEQVQEQDKEHTATPARAREKQPPTVDQFLAGAALAGVPEDFARGFYGELVAAGWRDADGLPVANWRRYLRKTYQDEVKKNSAARVSGVGIDDLPIAR